MISIQACPSYHPSSLAIYLNIWCCGRRETTSGNQCTECNAYLKLKHSGQSVWQDHLTLPFPQLWERLWCTTGSIWLLLRLHLTWHVDHSVPHPRVVPCVLDMGLQSLPGTPTALWLVVESESSAPLSCTGRGEGKQWGSDYVLLCPPSLHTPSGCLQVPVLHTPSLFRNRLGSCLQLQTTKQEFPKSFSILKRWAGCTQIIFSHLLSSWHCWGRRPKV